MESPKDSFPGVSAGHVCLETVAYTKRRFPSGLIIMRI